MSGLTRNQIRTQIRALIDQPDSSNSRFTDDQLNEYIDEAVNYTAVFIEYPRDFIEIQVEQNIGAYTLLTDTLVVRTAYFGDKTISGDLRPLTIISEETLKELYPSWYETNSNTNSRPQYLILMDRNTIYVHPKPDANNSAAGKKIVLDYIYNPAALSDDSSIPDLPVPYHGILQLYAGHLAYLRLNNADLSAKLLQMYRDKIKELKSTVTKETSEGLAFQFGYDPGLDDEYKYQLLP